MNMTRGGAWLKVRELAAMILEESETSDSRQKETHIRTLRKELDHLLRRKGLKVKARAGNLKSVWLPNDVLEAKALPAAYEIVSQGSEVSHTTKGSAEIREETESRIGPILLYVRQLTSLTTLTLDKPGTLTLYKPPDIWLPFLKQEVKQPTLELFFASLSACIRIKWTSARPNRSPILHDLAAQGLRKPQITMPKSPFASDPTRECGNFFIRAYVCRAGLAC